MLIFFKRPYGVSESIGLVESWKEIYVNSLQKVFTETRLSKTQLCKPRVSELRKQQCNVTRLQSFSHVVVLWQMQKSVCYCTVFALFYFEFDSNFQVQAPRGIYLEGRFNGGSLKLRAWGAYIQKGLYMEGHIFGILRFLWINQTSSQVHFNLVPWASTLCNLRIYRKQPSKNIYFL